MITDHKPLQAMFNKTASELPLRIEKFIMDFQEHDYVVEYHLGKTNIADYLSRHPEYAASPVASRQSTSSLGLWFKRKGQSSSSIWQQLLYTQEIREKTWNNETLTKTQTGHTNKPERSR